MSAFEQFGFLLDAHEDHAAWLLEHQAALVRGDVADARSRIRRLRGELAAHIEFENEVLLPLLEAAGGWSRIGDPAFYRREHERILALLDEYARRTDALTPGGPDVHREIALLIGAEQALRTLLEHHDDRERQGLYLDLVRITTPEQRRLLAARAPGRAL